MTAIPIVIIMLMVGTIGPKATWWEVGGFVDDYGIPVPAVLLPDSTCRDYHRWSPKVEAEMEIFMTRVEDLPEAGKMSEADAQAMIDAADDFLIELHEIDPPSSIEYAHNLTVNFVTEVRDLAQAQMNGDESEFEENRIELLRVYGDWASELERLDSKC